MKIIFRVDASKRIGTGHLMRCLTLAESLRERGAETRFVCRAHPGNLIELLQRKAIPVSVLPAPTKPRKERHPQDYAVCLGVTQSEDAEQTIKALHADVPDWLIVDHYGLDADWERKLRPYVDRLMVIDDLANRPHDCDFLLDQNYTKGGEDRYRHLVPKNCQIMLGPRFALLKPEYASRRQEFRPRDGEVQRVLVFFGGSDRRNMTALALEALSTTEFSHLEVDVVVGASNLQRVQIERQASSRPLTNLYGPLPHLADLMVQADIAIGGGGATTWERMCMGLPSLVICLGENQKEICEKLSESRLIQYVGSCEQLRSRDFCRELRKLLKSKKWLSECATQGQLLVDGCGVSRLKEILIPAPKEHLRFRTARESDIRFYFNWVNEHEVRQQSIQTCPISWEDHKKWFAEKLSSGESYLLVLEADSLPVGQIRFDRQGDEALIDYSLDPLVRGRGWGAYLVSMGISFLEEMLPKKLRAEIKTGNQASRSIFIRLGFDQILLDKARGVYVFGKSPPKMHAGSEARINLANILK